MSDKDGNGESKALVIFDRLDNDVIIAQLQGRSVTTWAYTFQQEGKKLSGLSVTGIEECSRLAAMRGEALRVLTFRLEDQGEAYFAMVECGRFAVREGGEAVLLDTALGTKREMKVKVRRSGGYYTDGNAADVAMSKAARNAKAKLLDPQLKEQVMAAALETGRVTVATPDDARRIERARRREEIPPPKEKVDEDQARRRFYATADDLGLATQGAIHGRLKLQCGAAQHDIDPKDRRYCNALRDSVRAYAQENRGSLAEAWEHYRALLQPVEEEPEGSPPDEWEELNAREDAAEAEAGEAPAGETGEQARLLADAKAKARP